MRSRYTIPIVASLTLTVGAVGAIGAGSFYSIADEARPSVRQFGYGELPDNDLDLYLPAAVAAAKPGLMMTPTVVLVHGGSWTRGDKEDLAKQAQQLVEAGYVAISVNYRLAPESPWPAQRKDLVTALKWIRAHALDLHVDTSRIVVLGSSAGGEIAAAALTQGAGRKLARGLITMSAPYDLGLIARDTTLTDESAELAETVTRDLLGCVSEECDIDLEKRSVFDDVDSQDPPSLLFASQREWVDPQNSIRYHQVALAQGLESRLVVFQGRRHGMTYWRDAWPIVQEWLTARMAAPK
ncbi:MAG: alpha/beta hydrolase [Sporichthya sp.]|nr:alpha/beta hydrolase [Sporichthya sp.]